MTGTALDRRKKRNFAPDRVDIFVMEYVKGSLMGKTNAAAAARAAGYAANSAKITASELLRRENVQEAIIELTRKAVARMEVDGPAILAELATIAFSPIIPGVIRASDKNKALDLLGTHHKLWEGSRGDWIININILAIDEKTL